MSALDSTTQSGALLLDAPAVAVGRSDVMCCLATFALSSVVLAYAMSPIGRLDVALALYGGALLIPAVLWAMQRRHKRELTLATLLLTSTAAAGPVGALGCTLLALTLWRRRPAPERLRHWYAYISGVVARRGIVRIYEELQSGRLPTDAKAAVPRFRPILRGASVEEQQRVLGVLGRRYHAEFRGVLREALRHKNGFIRAQAAAVASRLGASEKMRLWSTSGASTEGTETPPSDALPQK
jgi:hypothetical protein